MHNQPHHQASGLRAFAQSQGSRLVALVSHGDAKSELPLLWQLCMTWVDLGYSVTVLDAGTTESENNPGLEHILEYSFCPTSSGQSPVAWSVFPSALGLQALQDLSTDFEEIGRRLGHAFCDGGVVVLYGGVNAIAGLLKQHRLQPLLAVSSASESLLGSYFALKRLLTHPGLAPLVVDYAPDPGTGTRERPTRASDALAQCAKNFLAHDLQRVQLNMAREDAPPTMPLQQLALRILENAIPLPGRNAHWVPTGAKISDRTIFRSH